MCIYNQIYLLQPKDEIGFMSYIKTCLFLCIWAVIQGTTKHRRRERLQWGHGSLRKKSLLGPFLCPISTQGCVCNTQLSHSLCFSGSLLLFKVELVFVVWPFTTMALVIPMVFHWRETKQQFLSITYLCL